MCVHFPCVNLETPGRHLQVLKCVNFACWNPISDLLGALVRWQEERKKEVRRKKDLSRGSIRLSQSPLEFCSQIIDQAPRCYTQQLYHCPQSVFNGIPRPHSLSCVFPGCFFAVPVHFFPKLCCQQSVSTWHSYCTVLDRLMVKTIIVTVALAHKRRVPYVYYKT